MNNIVLVDRQEFVFADGTIFVAYRVGTHKQGKNTCTRTWNQRGAQSVLELFEGGVYFVQLESENQCGSNSWKHGSPCSPTRHNYMYTKNYIILLAVAIINVNVF